MDERSRGCVGNRPRRVAGCCRGCFGFDFCELVTLVVALKRWYPQSETVSSRDAMAVTQTTPHVTHCHVNAMYLLPFHGIKVGGKGTTGALTKFPTNS